MDNTETVLREIERKASRGGLPILGPEKGKLLDDIVAKHRPKRALEIGTLVGYSAIRIARLMPKNGQLICIEINAENAKLAKENIALAGLSGKVKIIVGDAKKVIPLIEGEFDLVFIDAEKREYLSYLLLVEKNLHKGSVVIADNAGMFADHMRDYLDYVRGSGKYYSIYREVKFWLGYKIEDGLEISVKL